MCIMCNLVSQNSVYSAEQIDQINKRLKQKGILTSAKELIDNAHLLIPVARNSEKFFGDVLKKSP